MARPLRVGPVTLRNRIVFPAHLTNAAVDGRPTAQHAAYYAERAAGGAAMIVVEEHSADPADRPYEHVIRGTDPAVVPGLRRITDAVHAHGAIVLAQIGHNGGQSSSLYSRAPVDAPSPVPDPMFREVPRVLSEARVARIVAGFAAVATHCAAGGYDGVEIQGSQASLLRQFLSPLTNRRDDRYADGVVLLEQVLAAVRAALGPDRVLGVRLQGDEGLAGGLTAADAAATAARVEHLLDYVSTAVGVATATLPLIEPPMGVPAGYAAHVPAAVRAAVRVPVLGVGRFTTPAEAEATLAAGSCDLVGVVRGQIADPAFARRALAGAPVRRCVGCNQECIARVGLNRTLGCVVNPRAGREAQLGGQRSVIADLHVQDRHVLAPRHAGSGAVPAGPERPVDPLHGSDGSPTAGAAGAGPGPRRVLVVGGGPAGLAAALAAARRGHRVRLVERSERLGGQIALAASAPARGELAHVVDDLARECAEAGVVVELGTGADAADAADAVVVATGAEPTLPAWAAGLDRVVDVADVLTGRAVPAGTVLVVDDLGGHHATSTAELLARRGCAVTITTAAMVAAEGLGPTLERPRWRRRAAALGIVSLTDRVVTGARPGLEVDVLHHPLGETVTWRPDWVVTASPRTPRVPAIEGVRVGDAVAPRDLGAATREGHAVGEQLCGP